MQTTTQIQYEEKEITIPMGVGSKEQFKQSVTALVGLGTGLAINHNFDEGVEIATFTLTHINSGREIAIDREAVTEGLAKLWLEEVSQILDWNGTMQQVASAGISKYGSSQAVYDAISDCYDRAHERWMNDPATFASAAEEASA